MDILFFREDWGFWYISSSVRHVPSNILSIDSLLWKSFGLVKVRLSLSHIPIVACLIPYLVMNFLWLKSIFSAIMNGSPLRTWVASTLLLGGNIKCMMVGLLSWDIAWNIWLMLYLPIFAVILARYYRNVIVSDSSPLSWVSSCCCYCFYVHRFVSCFLIMRWWYSNLRQGPL